MNHSTDERLPAPGRSRMLGVLALALFMTLIGVSIVNVALPSIEAGIGATQPQLQWVLSGYALTFGVVLVASGRAGDLYGRGSLFILGIAVFTVASIGAGFAPDPLWLNIARLVQGVGSGLVNPQVIGMIQEHFRGPERARAFGVFGGTVGISTAVGPLLGGLLIEFGGLESGWRWTFFVNVPLGVIAVVLACLWMPKPLLRRSADRAVGSARQLDIVGAVLLGLAVLALMLPFMEGREWPPVWFALPPGLLLVWAWALWERRYLRAGNNPMVDLSIFRIPSFTNGTLVVFLYFLGMTSVWVLVALYFQEGLGHTALEAGLVGLPSALLSAVSALLGGRLVTRHGRRIVALGLQLSLVGLVLSMMVVWLRSQGLANEWWLLVTLSVFGFAQGFVIGPNQTLTLAEVPVAYAGSSGGVMQTGQRIGATVGIAAITGISFYVLAISGWALAFLAGLGVILMTMIVALAVSYRDLRGR